MICEENREVMKSEGALGYSTGKMTVRSWSVISQYWVTWE